ncbi:hypothetical protein [Pelagicoccus sp. SDUM812003]|uniref:hypothetical protein n=1 Tax=Pelagicoccus sp. SDUM812003 TaxID=3041267 RepID=UPI0028114BFD|nr:hypothetical protein [Pelagicoccus sp. SDUM812003]
MIRLLSIILTLLAIPLLASTELPTPPDGYSWKPILEGQSALLIPEGWHFKSQHGKSTDGFFVSKEDIEKEGKFDTGLSLNLIRDVKKSTQYTPTQYSIGMMSQIEKEKEVLLVDSKDAGPFKAITIRYRDVKQGLPDVVIHNLFIANDQTGTLWFYMFESPEREWESAWKIGDTILSHLLIETEI